MALPKKLTDPAAGKAWADSAWRRSLRSYEGLKRRYAELGYGLPSVTQRLLSEKLDILEGMGAPSADWKAHAERRFSEINALRRDAVYPLAMLPLDIMRLEERVQRYKRSIELGHPGKRFVEKILKEEARLYGLGKKLGFLEAVSRPDARGAQRMIMTERRQYKGPDLLEDAGKIRAHSDAAKMQLDALKRLARLAK